MIMNRSAVIKRVGKDSCSTTFGKRIGDLSRVALQASSAGQAVTPEALLAEVG